jgi:RNA polymerase sigma-70 factor, ECF subfamily
MHGQRGWAHRLRSPEECTDEELIAAILHKDMRALEAFYDRHCSIAYALAVRVLGDAGDAEDVVQEAFASVWRAAETYRPERSQGRSWLLSIIHHRAIDRMRGRRVRPQTVQLEAGMSIADSTDVWREVSDHLTSENVRSALRQLPPEQRETIELAYFKGYTHVQIAQMMEVPLGTVKGRMRIGLHKLKSLLEGAQPEMVPK